jgi:carboxyl-terminal processing protease
LNESAGARRGARLSRGGGGVSEPPNGFQPARLHAAISFKTSAGIIALAVAATPHHEIAPGMICRRDFPSGKGCGPVYRHSISALALAACCFLLSGATAPLTLTTDGKRADLEDLIAAVPENYVYFTGKESRWSTIRQRYAARVDAAATQDEWSAVIEDILGELHDFHVGVRPGSSRRWLAVPTWADLWAEPGSPEPAITEVRAGSDAERAGIRVGDRVVAVGGISVAAALADRTGGATDEGAARWALLSLLTGRNGETRRLRISREGRLLDVTLPAQRRFDRPAGPVSVATTPEGFAVIRFNNSLGDQATVAAFDAALASVRRAPALILDLRDVPSGGGSTIALGILGRFVAERLPYQRHRIPRWGQADVERNWVEEVAPRGPFTYRRPLAVLVDHWTGSMGEGMAVGIDGMRRGTVIGTRMGRLAGAGGDSTLPRTGLQVTLPEEQVFHINGCPRHQWVPPVLVDPSTSFDRDTIMARGRSELVAQLATKHPHNAGRSNCDS